MIVVAEGNRPFSRLVVRHLLTRIDAGDIAVTATDPQWVADLAELGVEIRPEHVDPSMGATAFLEGDVILLASSPGIRPLLEVALASLPGRVVLVTKVALERTRHLFHLVHEGLVQDSGVPFTFLRKNVDSESFLPAAELAIGSGEFISSIGSGLVAPAARTDYAEAAAAVLAGTGHDGKAHDLTGPLGLKALGVASVFSQLAGRNIEVREVPQADVASELRNAGASAHVAAELEDLYLDIGMDEWSTASETLEELLGHLRIPLVEALASALRG